MRRRGWRGAGRGLLAAGTILLGLGLLRANLEPSKWRYARPIRVAETGGGIARFRVDSELYDRCLPDLADLRIAGEGGREVPFATRKEEGSSRAEWNPCGECGPTNETFVPGRSSSATFRFGRGREMKTALKISTPGENFRREVRVEASEDGVRWETLREGGLLFDIRTTPEGGPFRMEEVSIPPSDFPYLRITVFHGAGDPRRIRIAGLEWQGRTGTPPTLEPVPLEILSREEDAGRRASEVVLDSGARNRPIRTLRLDFEEPNFYRRIEVHGRNSRTEEVAFPVEDAPERRVVREVPWRFLSGGSIYRITAGSAREARLEIGLSDAAYRYLKIRIYNGDDRPLSLREASAEGVVRTVLFPAAGGTRYTLYYGNPRARRPGYDLTHFLPRLEEGVLLEAGLGAPGENPEYREEERPLPWSERNPALLWAALFLAVGVLALLVRRLARSGRPAA